MSKTIEEKYSRVRVNYTTGLPLDIIENLKPAAKKSGDKINVMIEKAIREYFAKHNLLDTG